MESVSNLNQINLKENQVIVEGPNSELDAASKIVFRGKGNLLQIEDGVRVSGTITFNGDNGLVFLSRNHNAYLVNLSINSNTTVFFGKGCYFNGRMTVITSERQNVLIGNDGLFSFGIFIRTADPHLVYDSLTKVRLNESKSVLIGDHVWLGQNTLILKGTRLGSGSIIAGGSVISNKTVGSNESFGGNPARLIRSNVFFSSQSVHGWDQARTDEYQVMDTDDFVFTRDERTIDLQLIDKRLKLESNTGKRLAIVKTFLVENTSKNRFAI